MTRAEKMNRRTILHRRKMQARRIPTHGSAIPPWKTTCLPYVIFFPHLFAPPHSKPRAAHRSGSIRMCAARQCRRRVQNRPHFKRRGDECRIRRMLRSKHSRCVKMITCAWYFRTYTLTQKKQSAALPLVDVKQVCMNLGTQTLVAERPHWLLSVDARRAQTQVYVNTHTHTHTHTRAHADHIYNHNKWNIFIIYIYIYIYIHIYSIHTQEYDSAVIRKLFSLRDRNLSGPRGRVWAALDPKLKIMYTYEYLHMHTHEFTCTQFIHEFTYV